MVYLVRLKLSLSNDPMIRTNTIFPYDSEEEVKRKNKKQFVTTEDATLTVIVDYNYLFKIYAPAFYEYDGATIPFNIGKGNMKLLIPALFHDIMCDKKNICRKLSTEIFEQLLIDCDVNPKIAKVMAIFVDLYQKYIQKWD